MKNQKENKSAKKVLIVVAVVLAAIIVIGLAAFNGLKGTGFILRSKTAAQTENYKVTGTMMSYFIGAAYQQYYSYMSYFGVDTTQSLKSQECSIDADGGTWFDYFVNIAKDSVNNILALCEYAKAHDIKLDADDKANIEANIDSLKENAKANSVSADVYASAVFGNGVKVSDIRKCLELSILADKASTVYQEEQENNVSVDEINAYYEANPEQFDGVDYYAYTISLTSDDDAETTDDTTVVDETVDTEVDDNTEEMANTAVVAVTFATSLKEASGSEEFIEKISEYEKMLNSEITDEELAETIEGLYVEHNLKTTISNEEAAEWLFDESTNVGDVNVVYDETNGQYLAFCLAKKSYIDESSTRSVRHILITEEDYPDNISEKATEIFDELKAADFSEEKWNELALEYSTDTGSNAKGGLYESIPEGETVTAFNDWLYSDERVAGDADIVISTYGYHIMQYVGENDDAVWQNDAKEFIVSERYTEMVNGYIETVNYDDSVISTIEY